LWTNLGGNFSPVASTTTLIDIGFVNFPSSVRLVANVGGWIADPASNNGWIILSPLFKAIELSGSSRAWARPQPAATSNDNFTPCRIARARLALNAPPTTTQMAA